ncbi:large ribosomal subunit protein mL55 isoform X2 [Anabrus simplex]|uniref:large ribosomal subunit protein mL55 isoform X2 n=1 Tax=Anabrus simplex TaxID=316456 RepID=UPI0034DDB118
MKLNLLSKFCHCPCTKYLPAYLPLRYLNSHTADICKTHRLTYARTYPTVVVAPDGSSINIRYNEPRAIIKLPLDLSTLSELERKLRIERRKPKEKLKIEEDIEDDFDANKYIHLIKK